MKRKVKKKIRRIHVFSHCVKSVQIRSYFWSVFSCIRTEYRKIRTKNNSVFGHFLRSADNLDFGDEPENKNKGYESD